MLNAFASLKCSKNACIMHKSLSFGRGFITFVYFIAPFHDDWNSTNTTEQIRGLNKSFVQNEMIRSQCTALFFEHDRSRYDAEIFPITRQYYGNDVIYAQYPVSICIWIAQELELKPSINFFTTNRCEAFIKIDFFSIFPLFFEPFNAVRKKSLKIFNIVFPGFGKNSALRSRHVLSSNFKTDYS